MKHIWNPQFLTGNYSYFDPQNDANRAFSVRLCITLFYRYSIILLEFPDADLVDWDSSIKSYKSSINNF